MSVPVSSELWIFLWTICGGIVLGFLFDIFRIKRRIIKTGIVLITLEDLLYWIIAAFVFFLIIYLFNEGQIRGFTFIGCFLGAMFYMSAISPIVLKVSVSVINAVIAGIRFIVKIVLLPVKFIIKLIKPPLRFIKRGVGNTSLKCRNSINNGIKEIRSKSSEAVKKRKKKRKRKKANKKNKPKGN